MAGRIEGKVAIVTGGARGLGAAIGARLAGEGARVVLVDRDQPEPVEPEDHRPEIARASSIPAHLGPPSEVSMHHEE